MLSISRKDDKDSTLRITCRRKWAKPAAAGLVHAVVETVAKPHSLTFSYCKFNIYISSFALKGLLRQSRYAAF
jgi:hypothetical protein